MDFEIIHEDSENNYNTHESAWLSDYRAFVDTDSDVFIIHSEGFLKFDFASVSATYPTFPVRPLALENKFVKVQ